MSNRMVISSSVREAGNDPIFHIAELAKNRIAEIGSEPVINSTIGSLMDDDGNLVAFDSVYSTFRSLNNAEIAGYASIAGIPEFLENVVYACFKHHQPKGYIEAVATPGGTGAVRNAIANYSEFGDGRIIEAGYVNSGMNLFLAWLSVLNTSYDTYDELGKVSIASFAINESFHIQDAILIPPRYLADNSKLLKEALVNYGGLTVHVYGASGNNAYYNEETHAQTGLFPQEV